ncbi:GNAT family N-acetyltransferase [Leifsonia sp. NPDC058292]|uniref:GNAT family N-acetyltransferase n=1 Tax=Leifsonia sp. NPDC058292 TaxID=3346428 RepID=UPI0036D7BBE4
MDATPSRTRIAGVTPALLDDLADRGWPAVQRTEVDGWSLRFSSGVTNRANSALPSQPVPDIGATVDAVEREYARRDLPAVFQVSEATPAGVAEHLIARGYAQHSATGIMVAAIDDVLAAGTTPAPALWKSPRVDVSDAPDDAWLDLWWSVDGRGDDAAKSVAREILTGGPALYAAVPAPGTPEAVARLALVGEWGGLFAVATHPLARRRGRARAAILALASAAQSYGIGKLWLQVMADNTAAIRLYDGLGFERASSYVYFTR